MARTLENLLGDHVIRQTGEKVQINSLCGKDKVIGIYFSADWCPPCKGFTPKLVEFYNKLKGSEQNLKFEIVFVSWDKDEHAFTEYFATMPWLALPFGIDRKVQFPLKLKKKQQQILEFNTAHCLISAKENKLKVKVQFERSTCKVYAGKKQFFK